MSTLFSKHDKGFGLVEILIAASIITVVITAASAAWNQYIKLAAASAITVRTALLTEEAGEALQLIRDRSWTSNIAPLINGTAYYLTWNGSNYATTTTPIAFRDQYAIKFMMSAVSRDGSSNIVTSGGSNDTNSRRATIQIVTTSATNTPLASSDLILHNVYSN